MLAPIDTADDPRIAAYRAVRDRDLIRGDGQFIVEGTIALERLIAAARFPLLSLLIAENRAERLAPLIGALDPAIPVHIAPQSVMDAITGFHIHRGVLALAQRTAEQTPAHCLAAHGDGPLLALGLIGLSNHDNVGGCFRNAAAFGADAVLLDAESCDPLYRKSIRVSSGAAVSLPYARGGDAAAMLQALHAHGVEAWALSPSGGEPLHLTTPPPRLAILLGAEGPGLPSGILAHARRVTIPMAGGMDSLNVATAGAIALAHAAMSRP